VYVLIGPTSELRPRAYPVTYALGVYAHLTSGRGAYAAVLQLHDPDGRILWQWHWPQTISFPTPLHHYRLAVPDATLEFPAPGHYDLVLLANDKFVARHALVLFPPGPPAGAGRSGRRR
jgi:hypothetical protein